MKVKSPAKFVSVEHGPCSTRDLIALIPPLKGEFYRGQSFSFPYTIVNPCLHGNELQLTHTVFLETQ